MNNFDQTGVLALDQILHGNICNSLHHITSQFFKILDPTNLIDTLIHV